MNLDNFVVRSHRRLVEKYAKQEAWQSLAGDAMAELSHQVAGLPTELDPENEEAKRFDLLSLNLQLALLRAEPGFQRMRDRVKEIAAMLEEKEAIPLVREQMPLIQALGTAEWWQDVTIPMLEVMRIRVNDTQAGRERRKQQGPEALVGDDANPSLAHADEVIGDGAPDPDQLRVCKGK